MEENESPIDGPLPMKIIRNLFLVVCHAAWSVRMTSCNFRLLTGEKNSFRSMATN